jgi:N6-L-threonylcarbamoyladenine synthase
MRLLAIETSCDETAVAILEAEGTPDAASFRIRGNALYSQASKHAAFGGVYPNLAKREHAANLVPLLHTALTDARLRVDAPTQVSSSTDKYLRELLAREQALYTALITYLRDHAKPSVDAVAVTQGPGLEPALWVGINFARALAYVWELPIIPVNHLEGHIVASAVSTHADQPSRFTVDAIEFPLLGLVLSGGHTEFIYAPTWGDYRVIGSTRDDSIGEAFDKVARLLGIPYPGGPGISALAHTYRTTRNAKVSAPLAKRKRFLPRPMEHSPDLDFSFSGLKTAVLYHVRELGELTEDDKGRVAEEFEEAVTDVVLAKTERALMDYPVATFVIGGGVSANTYLRKRISEFFRHQALDTSLRLPAIGLSTDNAIMIGMAGYFMHMRGAHALTAHEPFRADGTLRMHTHSDEHPEQK